MEKKKKIPIKTLLFLLFLVGVVGWALTAWNASPTRPLDILIVNKTVIHEDGDYRYRKHKGLTWVLNHFRYVHRDGEQEMYTEEDYLGPKASEDGTTYPSIHIQGKMPDVLFLSDAYGVYEQDGVNNNLLYGGISQQELNLILNAQVKGVTVMGEFNITSAPTTEEVRNSLGDVFGIEFTQWFGRYFHDLSTDEVPEWVHVTYEKSYGVPWDYRGAGIVLASTREDLVILAQGVDFDEEGAVKFSITDAYKQTLNLPQVNYYSWFEVVYAKYGTDVLANFSLELNETGRERIRALGIPESFAAIFRQWEERKRSVYFAGDFTDYTGLERPYRLPYASKLFGTFSLEKDGDTSHFFWRIYAPLMERLLENIRALPPLEEKAELPIVTADHSGFAMSPTRRGMLHAVNLEGVLPGADDNYLQDSAVYRQWFADIQNMGMNAVRIHTLMPPAFYSALEEYNLLFPERPLYFIQEVPYAGELASLDESVGYIPNMQRIVDAVHGNHGGTSEAGVEYVYISNVSEYLIAYIVNPQLTEERIREARTAGKVPMLPAGAAFRHTEKASLAEQWAAWMLNETNAYELAEYGVTHVLSLKVDPILLPRTPWTHLYVENQTTFDPANITVAMNSDFFLSLTLGRNDLIYRDSVRAALDFSEGAYDDRVSYSAFLEAFATAELLHPLAVDAFGLSTSMNAYENITAITGFSEEQQGIGIVEMMKSIEDNNFIGFMLSSWHDNWSLIGEEHARTTIPLSRNAKWHNVLDPEQNFGVLAMDAPEGSERMFTLNDQGSLMSSIEVSANETYLYLTLHLSEEIDYSKADMVIGIDTYERNGGEYRYADTFYATSFSGMEYIIYFRSQYDVELHVIPRYNISKGRYASSESYLGEYEYVGILTYGNFEDSNTQIYKAGSSYYMRLPWASLGFADPSRRMVIHDPNHRGSDADIRTTMTDGIMFSMMVGNLETYDTLYRFPQSKSSTGFRRYYWLEWEDPNYEFRFKKSYYTIRDYLRTKTW